MDQATMLRALEALGLGIPELDSLKRLPMAHATEGLKKLQERCRASYRKLAFELHPDRTGGDQDKTQLFNEVTQANKWVQDLKIQPPSPRPVVFQMVHYPARSPFGGTVTTTTTRVNQHYPAHRVVFIKVH